MVQKRTVVHTINLSDIGGVQQMFVPLYNMLKAQSRFHHKVFGLGKCHDAYRDVHDYHDITESLIAKVRYATSCISPYAVLHFQNMLGRPLLHAFLRMVPYVQLMFNEHGAIWNARDEELQYYRMNAALSRMIVANSHATKTMLMKRAGIDPDKIRVVYNGFMDNAVLSDMRNENAVVVGYIGRLVEFKGVQSFIKSAKLLAHEPKMRFKIAGSGYYENELRQEAHGYSNIEFLGEVSQPLEFIKNVDILIVPSVREPLGNVIIEAGYCRKAVIATRVDGIPELISHGESGVLLSPREEIRFEHAELTPQYVVDPDTMELVAPRQLDHKELAEHIYMLGRDAAQRVKYGEALYERVSAHCTLSNYFSTMEEMYKTL